MSVTVVRGRILSFTDRPTGAGDSSSYEYFEDGAIAMGGGTILAYGTHAAVAGRYSQATAVDHRPHLIMPGFIDTHNHFPQTQVIGSYGARLLDWLNTYTFPEEARYADPDHCTQMAGVFLDLLFSHGTTTAVTFCSSHKHSADAVFAEAERRGMCLIAGKVMMDRNAPAAVCDTVQSSFDDSQALIDTWHGRSRLFYAISPRFAITSTPQQLEMARALKQANPACYVQTHLSENDAEIALTQDLYPQARDYLDVYEHYELTGPRSLFGHCLHLSARERQSLAQSGSVAVFCPTSNLFLGSGLFDLEGLTSVGARVGLATDVGGGTSYSMLKTMDEAYKVLQLRNQSLNPLSSFYMATLGNARALQLEARIGTLRQGSDADLVVLDSMATPGLRQRMQTIETLEDELFALQTLGGERAVSAVYVAGTRV